MEENNPFQPALSEPVDDSTLGNLPQSDDFANLDEPEKNPHAFDFGADEPENSENEENLADFAPTADQNFAKIMNDGNEEENAKIPEENDDSADFAKIPEENPDEKVEKAPENENPKAKKEAEKLAKKAEKDAKKAKKHEKSAKNPHDPNAPKQLTITLPMIILAILMLAFAGAAFYFWQGQNKANSELNDANAKVAQLQDEIDQASNSTNVSSGQFSSLQDKIAQMTKQQSDDTKTISDQKNQINDLNTKLTAANQQASQIKSVTDQISALLGQCSLDASVKLDGGQTGGKCSAAITQANGANPAGITIKLAQ